VLVKYFFCTSNLTTQTLVRFGLDPDAFRQLVRDAVDEHFDNEIWERVEQENSPEAAAKDLKKQAKEEILPLLQQQGKGDKKKKKQR
jgi:hypothetical protein